MLGRLVEDHSDGAFTHFWRMLTGSSHGSHPLSEWALRPTRYASHQDDHAGASVRLDRPSHVGSTPAVCTFCVYRARVASTKRECDGIVTNTELLDGIERCGRRWHPFRLGNPRSRRLRSCSQTPRSPARDVLSDSV